MVLGLCMDMYRQCSLHVDFVHGFGMNAWIPMRSVLVHSLRSHHFAFVTESCRVN